MQTRLPLHNLLENIQPLLEKLRHAKYAVSLADFAVIQALLLRMLEGNTLDVPPDADPDALRRAAEQRLQGMLAAVLCRTPREQQEFPRHYRAWLEEQRATAPDTPQQDQTERPAPVIPTRPRWLLPAFFLVLLIFLGSVGYLLHQSRTEPAPLPDPPQTAPIGDIPIDEAQPDASSVFPPAIPQPDTPPPVDETPADDTTQPEEAIQTEPPGLVPAFLAGLSPWWLLLLALPLVPWGIRYLNRQYLHRRLAAAGPELARLKLRLPVHRLFQAAALGGTLQQLRRHQAVATARLDIHATLESSVRNLGLFTPVNARGQRRPEYLVLVDRASRGDQQSALVESLLARLHREGVAFERWYFEQDPRWCFEADKFTPHLLSDLGARYADWRLLIFSPGHRFVDPVSGRPAEWLAQLDAWPRRALFTLEPPNRWRYLQKLLEPEGLLVAPADEAGLRNFIAGLDSPRITPWQYLHSDKRPPYPALLVSEPWLQRIAPPAPDIRALLDQLRAYLGPAGLHWLAACAVYPELHWRLTLYLGEQLDVLDETRLARLTSLPWLRHNYMPDWLRLALLETLPRAECRRLRRLFQPILAGSAFSAAAGEVETRISAAGQSTPRADTVCVDFLAGKLGLPLPGVVRPERPERRRVVWRNALATGLAGLVAGWFAVSPLRDTALEWLVETLPAAGMEQQAIGRLNLTVAPDPVQLSITHPAVAERRETISNSASLWLRAGEQTLLVTAPEHADGDYRVTLRHGQSVTLDIQLARLPKPDQDREDIPAPAVLKLEVYPADARLSLTPTDGGETINVARMEQSGMREPADASPDAVSAGLQFLPLSTAAYQNELRPGQWILRATADGFAPLQRTWSLSPGQARAETLELQRPDGRISLTVQTVPAAARVRIMNIRPVYRDGILLEPGPYDLEVTHDGYAEWREIHDLAQDSLLQVVLAQLHTLDLKLTPADAVVKIETLAAEQAPAPWDQLDTAAVRDYQSGMALAVGRYGLHIRRFGYLAKQEILALQADTALAIELEKAPTGTLRLSVKPAEAQVTAKPNLSGLEDLTGLQPGTNPLAAGEWIIRAEAENHEALEQTITIRVGETSDLNLDLQPLDGPILPEMVNLPGGTFKMGDIQGGGDDDERPVHEVTLSPFSIGKYEVTFEEYDRFCAATGRKKPDDAGWGRGKLPVINVSWNDAQAYAQWLSQQTGEQYRLPTEAEWEYAARAGTQTKYWWGNAIGTNNANCGKGCGDRFEYTAPVGSFKANPFGLYDTAGNVWEWTCSAWQNPYAGEESRCSDSAGADRVYRGGGWSSSPRLVRSANRYRDDPANRYRSQGFRLARTDPRSSYPQFREPEMVKLKGGTFRMGDIQGGGDDDERPVHEVMLSPFEMGKYEVTVGEFKLFVEAENYLGEKARF